MMVWVALAGCLSFWALCAGLVVGEGWLRVGGAAGLSVCVLAGWLLDAWYSMQEKRALEAEALADDSDGEWVWPDRRAA